MTVFLPHQVSGPLPVGTRGESTSIKLDFSRSWGGERLRYAFLLALGRIVSQFPGPSGYQRALHQDLSMPPSAPRIRWPAPGSYP